MDTCVWGIWLHLEAKVSNYLDTFAGENGPKRCIGQRERQEVSGMLQVQFGGGMLLGRQGRQGLGDPVGASGTRMQV